MKTELEQMEKNKTADEINLFSIVINEWRDGLERESGLGIVTSVPQSDGLCWVVRILKDKEGYFLCPTCECRFTKVLRLTDKKIEDLSIKFVDIPKTEKPIDRVKAISKPA